MLKEPSCLTEGFRVPNQFNLSLWSWRDVLQGGKEVGRVRQGLNIGRPARDILPTVAFEGAGIIERTRASCCGTQLLRQEEQ